MAGTAYQIRTYGEVIVSRKLTRMAEIAGDMRPAWPACIEVIARGYRNSFRLEGPGWAPLKRSTELRRIREGFAPGPIRHRSGADFRAMTNAAYLASSHMKERPHELDVWGTDVAELHQFGFTNRGRDVPARPLSLTRWYQDQIARTIERELMAAYGGA